MNLAMLPEEAFVALNKVAKALEVDLQPRRHVEIMTRSYGSLSAFNVALAQEALSNIQKREDCNV